VTRHDARVDPIWVGMVDVRPAGPGGPLGEWSGGAYAYCAGRAPDLARFLARLSDAAHEAELELVAIDWMAGEATLPDEARASPAVRDVIAAAGSGGVVFDHFYGYPEADDPEAGRLDALKGELEAFVGNWLDGAVDAYDAPFRLESYAFVAELDFGDDVTVGWAGRSADPVGLLRRAIDALEEPG
jgi:hypothetical protein